MKARIYLHISPIEPSLQITAVLLLMQSQHFLKLLLCHRPPPPHLIYKQGLYKLLNYDCFDRYYKTICDFFSTGDVVFVISRNCSSLQIWILHIARL